MAANISISEATESDLPDMVAFCCNALEADILTSFLYDHRHAEAVGKQTESLMASLGKIFTHPTNRCYIFKAADSQMRELIGWILVKWEDGKYIVPPESGSDKPGFVMYHTPEWTYVPAIGALYVRTDWQRHGIGRHLMEYIYSKYDLDNELVILQARAMSKGFCAKLGRITVDSTDIDPSEWGGEGRGYGLHRSQQMLRYPKLSEPYAADA